MSRNSSENRRSPILDLMKIDQVLTSENARKFFEIYLQGESHWLRRDAKGNKLYGGRQATFRLYRKLSRDYPTILNEELVKANHLVKGKNA